MNKERELLSQALEELEIHGEKTTWGLIERIRTYLSTPSDDAEEPTPVAWLIPGTVTFDASLAKANGTMSAPLYLHPPKPTEPEAKPVLYIKEQELLYIQVLKQEGLAQEWKSNLGFVKEAGDVGLYLHPPKPAEPEAEYDFYGVIPLTHRKAKGIIKDKGYHVTGFVLSRPDGDKCIVDMSAVRWLTGKEFFEMMHPPVVSPTAEPEANCYGDGNVYRGVRSKDSEVKTVYVKTAEQEAETIETLKAENFKLASGQCTEGGPWGDEGGTPYCKYAEPAARKKE